MQEGRPYHAFGIRSELRFLQFHEAVGVGILLYLHGGRLTPLALNESNKSCIEFRGSTADNFIHDVQPSGFVSGIC